jgi:hypothetical protein
MHESIGTFHTRIRQRTQKEQDLLCSFLALVHSIHFLTTGEREEEESLGTVLHDTQGTYHPFLLLTRTVLDVRLIPLHHTSPVTVS